VIGIGGTMADETVQHRAPSGRPLPQPTKLGRVCVRRRWLKVGPEQHLLTAFSKAIAARASEADPDAVRRDPFNRREA